MSFLRVLDEKQIAALFSSKNIELFNLLKKDIISGVVFPAVRNNQIYFYYEGGCLYKFANGKFSRDKAFEKYGCKAEDLSPYETAKIQVKNKFTNICGNDKERRLLNSLYSFTFGTERRFKTIVLDIEVNLNGNVARGKKCDLVLYNVQQCALMFVEGKVFFDSRVNVRRGSLPEVIEQVNTYSAAIEEQAQTISSQYANYVKIINNLFGTNYSTPKKLVQPAKLLVYETPLNLTENNFYSIETITAALGANNTVWFNQNERPSADEIWNSLCK
ncbi:MAG: hypothetical protein K2O41_02045 [Clostridia bacterium]|nr:hypothetical protein [Clostridia bacterium]